MNESLSPSEVEAYPLSESIDISKFECGRKLYDEYLRKTASDDHNSGIGKVWIFIHREMVAGYVTIAMSQLHKSKHKKLGEMTTHDYIPGMLLGQMARDKNYKGREMGKIMISWVVREAIKISKRVGCRLIILQSEEDKILTYENFGFIKIPDSKRKKNMMFFDLSWYQPNSNN